MRGWPVQWMGVMSHNNVDCLTRACRISSSRQELWPVDVEWRPAAEFSLVFRFCCRLQARSVVYATEAWSGVVADVNERV